MPLLAFNLAGCDRKDGEQQDDGISRVSEGDSANGGGDTATAGGENTGGSDSGPTDNTAVDTSTNPNLTGGAVTSAGGGSAGTDTLTGGPGSGNHTGSTGQTSQGPGTGSDSSGVDNTGTTTSDPGPECANVSVSAEKVTPWVYLLVDQSGSMDYDLDGQSRWTAVKSVLVGNGSSDRGVVGEMESEVNFALDLYSRTSSECPVMVTVPPMASNYNSVRTTLNQNEPAGGTPSGDAIKALGARMMMAGDPDSPKILVFATDGDPYAYPNCGHAAPDNGSTTLGMQDTITQVQALHTQGIKTFVISVGNSVSGVHLQDVAEAGVGGVNAPGVTSPTGTDQWFFLGTDKQKLKDAFRKIIGDSIPCAIPVDPPIPAGYEDAGQLRVNGTLIPYKDPNGWKVNSVSEIELVGDACRDLRNSRDVQVEAVFHCKPVIPG